MVHAPTSTMELSSHSMDSRVGHRGSRRALRVGLAIVFGIFIVEAVVDSFSSAEIDRRLLELTQATGEVRALMRSTDQVVWVARGAGLLALAILGWWLGRRIGRYEAQLTAHAREVEERNHDLDAFAGRVAHDLKNALEPLVLAPELLRRMKADPGRVLEVAERTERCSKRANAMLDALLAFARASGSRDADAPADVGAVVKDVLEELAPRVAELNVSIEVQHPPDLCVACDRGLLQVVLANLCGNAVKYLVGQPERRVRITATKDDGFCRLEVEDTGPGIPKQAQQRIFEPFFRVEGTRAPGTGIGLATVRRVVDRCGGRVSVESIEGRGSRFAVWLPLAKSPDGRAAKGLPPRPPALHP
jgi:signal transduction histidine kinase